MNECIFSIILVEFFDYCIMGCIIIVLCMMFIHMFVHMGKIKLLIIHSFCNPRIFVNPSEELDVQFYKGEFDIVPSVCQKKHTIHTF